LNLKEADEIVSKIYASACSRCTKIEVAGSVRRRRSNPHDIDIVLIPENPLMWQYVVTTIAKTLETETQSSSILKMGSELVTIQVGKRDWLTVDYTVDVYRATPETWGTILLIRTGSKEHNIKLCVHAKTKGLMLSAARGVIKDSKVIASRTEEEIFEALNLPYRPPEERKGSPK